MLLRCACRGLCGTRSSNSSAALVASLSVTHRFASAKSGKPKSAPIHEMSSSKSAATASYGASSADDEIASYSPARHAGYLLLHGRRMWMPLVLGAGYYALQPLLLSSVAAHGAYLTLAVLLQRLAIRGRPNTVVKDLRGYTCVVTGATSGIGLYTAAELLSMGARVVVASKPGKEAATMEFFQRYCRAPPGDCEPLEQRVSFLALDLGDQLDVMAAAARLKALVGDRVDILVNCAGVWRERPSVTRQGFEEHIGINFLGPFHFTEALLPSLRRAPKKSGRVVYVTCAAHNGVKRPKVVEERLQLRPGPDVPQLTARCYSASKLGNIYHAQSIAERRYEGIPLNERSELHPVDACIADPGFTDTNLGRDPSLPPPLLGTGVFGRAVRSLWCKDAHEGSQTVVHCCVRDSVEGGGYYAECTLMPGGLSKRAQDPQCREEVVRWAMAKTIAKYYSNMMKK